MVFTGFKQVAAHLTGVRRDADALKGVHAINAGAIVLARGRQADWGGVSVGSLGVSSMQPLGGLGGGATSIAEGTLDLLWGGALLGGLVC